MPHDWRTLLLLVYQPVLNREKWKDLISNKRRFLLWVDKTIAVDLYLGLITVSTIVIFYPIFPFIRGKFVITLPCYVLASIWFDNGSWEKVYRSFVSIRINPFLLIFSSIWPDVNITKRFIPNTEGTRSVENINERSVVLFLM